MAAHAIDESRDKAVEVIPVPRRIRIRRRTWRIYREPSRTRALFESLNGKTMREAKVEGLCLPDSREIHLRDGLSAYQQDDTFCHELIHAMMSRGKMRLKERDEEALCMDLAPELARIIRVLLVEGNQKKRRRRG